MAGKKGESGPPGNANAFRHGLAAVQRRRADGTLTDEEQDIRADILTGLIADKGGEQQIGKQKARMMWWISWGSRSHWGTILFSP
ncbi:MAG TPA: hypothetical protein VGJ66_18585 [Pyrinomonadaceae bacterium]|jgi:hypothetical protein